MLENETCLPSRSSNNTSHIQINFLSHYNYLQTNLVYIRRLILTLGFAFFGLIRLADKIFLNVSLVINSFWQNNSLFWATWQHYEDMTVPTLKISCFWIFLFSGYSIAELNNLKASSLSNKRLLKVSTDNILHHTHRHFDSCCWWKTCTECSLEIAPILISI